MPGAEARCIAEIRSSSMDSKPDHTAAVMAAWSMPLRSMTAAVARSGCWRGIELIDELGEHAIAKVIEIVRQHPDEYHAELEHSTSGGLCASPSSDSCWRRRQSRESSVLRSWRWRWLHAHGAIPPAARRRYCIPSPSRYLPLLQKRIPPSIHCLTTTRSPEATFSTLTSCDRRRSRIGGLRLTTGDEVD
jgi:hypothetical protein